MHSIAIDIVTMSDRCTPRPVASANSSRFPTIPPSPHAATPNGAFEAENPKDSSNMGVQNTNR